MWYNSVEKIWSEGSGYAMSDFKKEFRTFINKGNILDLAVAVVVGNAFKEIVNSLANNVILPAISLLTGGINHTEKWIFELEPAVVEDGVETKAAINISLGVFAQAVVNFLITAFFVFLALWIIRRTRRKVEDSRGVKKSRAQFRTIRKKLVHKFEDINPFDDKKVAAREAAEKEAAEKKRLEEEKKKALEEEEKQKALDSERMTRENNEYLRRICMALAKDLPTDAPGEKSEENSQKL